MKNILIAGSIALLASLLLTLALFRLNDIGSFNLKNEDVYVEKLSVCGWLPWWDYENAVSEYAENEEVFDTVSPFIYSLEADGEIALKIDGENSITDFREGTEVIPSISNEFDGERVSVIINNTEETDKHISDVVELVNRNNFNGIELDYEYLIAEDKDEYSEFIRRLSQQLHDNSKKLVVTLHPKTTDKGTWHAAEAQDWEELAKHADKLRVMAYDFSWEESNPGPISPYPWFKKVLIYSKKKIPKEKLVFGVGLYGYDWVEGGTRAQDKTLVEVNGLIQKHKGELNYNNKDRSPSFIYKEQEGSHVVWYENELSLDSKVELLIKEGISNICIWRLGGTPREIFDIF